MCARLPSVDRRSLARYNFAKVSRQVGLRAPAAGRRHGRGPRLHDMRHRFAVCTLLRWYRAGLDVEREIPRLATYLAFEEPAYADQCRRILACPSKRYERRLIEYLTAEEIDAMLAAPDRTAWIGRRDRALLLVGIQTGLRVSELIGLRRCDLILGAGAHVRCEGKGRKQRCTPLRPEAVAVLAQWLRECPAEPASPAFPSSRGGP